MYYFFIVYTTIVLFIDTKLILSLEILSLLYMPIKSSVNDATLVFWWCGDKSNDTSVYTCCHLQDMMKSLWRIVNTERSVPLIYKHILQIKQHTYIVASFHLVPLLKHYCVIYIWWRISLDTCINGPHSFSSPLMAVAVFF